MRSEQTIAGRMGACDGPVFLFCARNDREMIHAFQQAAKSLGLSAREGRAVSAAADPAVLADRPDRDVLLVGPELQDWLGRYLDACPAGTCPLVLYSRRRGNEGTPRISAFLAFLAERGADIWELEQGEP